MIASGIQPGADKQKAQRAQRAPEHRAKQPRQLLPEGTLSRKKNPHDQQTDRGSQNGPHQRLDDASPRREAAGGRTGQQKK